MYPHKYGTPRGTGIKLALLSRVDSKSLLQAVDMAITMNVNGDYGLPVPDYVEENVSTKVVNLIQSYTGVVDRMVWKKY